MWNARLYEAQTGIKTSRRNINNLRYADDTTLVAESDEKLKRLLMKVKEESKIGGLNSTFKEKKKKKDHGISPITSWQRDEKTMETLTEFILLGSKITADGVCSHEIK